MIPVERSFTAHISSERPGGTDEAQKVLKRINSRLDFAREVRPLLATFSDVRTRLDLTGRKSLTQVYAAKLSHDPTDRYLLDGIILRAADVTKAAATIENERPILVASFTEILLIWLATFGLLLPLTQLATENRVQQYPSLVLFSIGVAALPVLLLYEIFKLHQVGKYSINIQRSALAA